MMEESKHGEASNNKTQKSDSEATSKETLSDIRENEKQSGSTAVKHDSGPSPDGAFDESGEIKDAGPM